MACRRMDGLPKNWTRILRKFPTRWETRPSGRDSVCEETSKPVIDDLLLQGLLPLPGTYIQGLELQIDRLKADNDVGAITLIKEEIEKTKNSTTYFANLVTGGKFGDE